MLIQPVNQFFRMLLQHLDTEQLSPCRQFRKLDCLLSQLEQAFQPCSLRLYGWHISLPQVIIHDAFLLFIKLQENIKKLRGKLLRNVCLMFYFHRYMCCV